MPKKKIDTKSVALFDDISVPEVPSKKKEPKVSRNTKEAAKEDSTSKTSKSISKDKTLKDDTRRTPKHNTVSSSKHSSAASDSTSVRNTKRNTVSKTKEDSKPVAGRKPKGTSSSTQKSKSSRESSRKTVKEPAKTTDATSKSRKSDKKSSDGNSKSTSRRPVQKQDTKPARDDKRVEGNESTNVGGNAELFKEAKKHKHKFTRSSIVWGPKQISGGPIKVNDDFVGIIIDGEYFEVSPWSVKNGVYHQGLDSNYLVHYLHYESNTNPVDYLKLRQEQESKKKPRKRKE